MNRDEILEKSRKENKGMDEHEARVLASAGRLAAIVGMLVCCLSAVLEAAVSGRFSAVSWMIYFSILAALFTYKYAKLRARHELWLAILFSLLFVFFTVVFVIQLF